MRVTATDRHVTTPVDSARLHRLLAPATPTERFFVAIPETELFALRDEMLDELPRPILDDLSQLSNVSRDHDIYRSAILNWWYEGTDWRAYRQDERWRSEASARGAALWEVERIFAALAPHGRALFINDAVSPDLPDPWLISLDFIDVASFLRIRLGYAGSSQDKPVDVDAPIAPEDSGTVRIRLPKNGPDPDLRYDVDGRPILTMPHRYLLKVAQSVLESHEDGNILTEVSFPFSDDARPTDGPSEELKF